MNDELKLSQVKVFAVLRNALNGELGVVMSVSGDRIDLKDKTGAVSRFKFGKHFSLADHDEAVDFRAAARAASKGNAPQKKRRPRTLQALLNRLAKKR
jgi:hypothetical protein